MMQTMQRLFVAFVVAAATLAAQNPLLNLLVNTGSGIPPGLPNSGIAQGSVFRLWGGRRRSQYPSDCPSAPPSDSRGNLHFRYGEWHYAYSANVFRKLRTGGGRAALEYPDRQWRHDPDVHGSSGSIPITVVPATFGISRADEYLTDNGWDVRSVAVVTFPDYQYVTDTNTAKPGDVLNCVNTYLY
jgi:hypothetical protein